MSITMFIYAAFGCFGLAGALALVQPHRNTSAQILMMLGALSGGIAAAYFAITAMSGGQGTVYLAGGIFRLQASSAFFFALVSLGALLTSAFAIGYLPRYAASFSLREVNFASALFVSGMLAVILSNSPAAFMVSWEVMSLSAYFLVIADRSEESLYAGFLYFIMTQLGFFALLAGFLVLAQGAIFAPWLTVSASTGGLSATTLAFAFLLLFIGFGSKAGLVPLHQWLPYAHPQAPSHSSALLSGAMLSVALFGFLESLRLFPIIALWWAAVVIVVGLISAVFGSIHAAVENDAKRLLAWSSIEHMGLLFTGAGALCAMLALGATPITLVLEKSILIFIFLHAANHLLFKAGLFMSVGAIVSETHTRDLDLMGGLARTWPAFSGVVLVLALASAALPPLGVFFGEWLFVQALAISIANLPPVLAAAAAGMLSTIALSAGLALFASVKLFSTMFLGRPRTAHAEEVSPLPLSLIIPPAVCAVALAVSGLALIPILSKPTVWFGNLTIVPGAVINPLYIAVFAVIVFGTALAFTRIGKRSMRTTGTWDCGAPLTSRMQYSATGFSAPVRFFFRMFLIVDKQMLTTTVSHNNPWIVRHTLAWGIHSVWEHWMYSHVGKYLLAVSAVVRRLQNGVVQMYLFLVLATLIITIAFTV